MSSQQLLRRGRLRCRVPIAGCLSFLACVLIVAACGGGSNKNPVAPSLVNPQSPQANQAGLFKGVAATRTDNPNLPAVAIHEHGDQLAVATGLSGAGAAGTTLEATFRRLSGESATVVLGTNGFPESARFADVVVLFDNYTESTVDLAVVPSTGETIISRAVAVDPALLSSLRSLSARLSAPGAARLFRPTATADDWLAVLKFASVGLKVASCAASVGAGAVPLAAYACSHAIVDVLYLMTDTEKPLLLESVGAIGDTALCVVGDAASCVEAAISGASLAIQHSQSVRQSLRGAIDNARGRLSSPAPTPTPDVGRRPIARDDSFLMRAGDRLQVNAPGVLANDDLIGSIQPSVEFDISTFPNGSSFENLNQGAGGFVLDMSRGDPAREFVGVVRIRYFIHSRAGQSNVATMSITVSR